MARPERKVRQWQVLLVLVAVPLVLWGLFAVTLGRSPLAGADTKNFGTVRADVPRQSFDHTFQLRNRLSEAIIIENVSPSCGCVVPVLSTHEIGPGQTLDIPVTLNLSEYGRKSETVTLIMQGRGVRVLTLRANLQPPAE